MNVNGRHLCAGGVLFYAKENDDGQTTEEQTL